MDSTVDRMKSSILRSLDADEKGQSLKNLRKAALASLEADGSSDSCSMSPHIVQYSTAPTQHYLRTNGALGCMSHITSQYCMKSRDVKSIGISKV